MNKSERKWVLFIFILAGLVIGGLLGEFARRNSSLWWLAYGMNFGLPSTLKLNLIIIVLEFGFYANITVANIIGIILGVFTYRYTR